MIGWDYIKDIEKSRRPVDPEDLPPELSWEAPVWALFTRLQTQVRESGGIDYNPAIVLMDRRGWDVDLGLSLLQAIELQFIELDNEDNERQR